MRIILVRHGETIWNAARIMQLPETPLSPRGELQAASCARRLRDEAVAAILASDYMRAQQTATAIAGATGMPITSTVLLRERNFGVHRGSSLDGFDVDVFAPGYHPPEGESERQFCARVALAWEEMLAFAEAVAGDLVVVSHALVVRRMIEHHLDTRVLAGAATSLRLPNTAVTIFDRTPPHAVHVLACAAHLSGDALPDTRVHPSGI